MIYGLEKPFQYSEFSNKERSQQLDYSLVCNKLNGFDWEQVLAVDHVKGSQRRMSAIRISGTVVDSKNMPVADALVSLTSVSLQQFNTISNQHGEFAIHLPVSVDKKNLSASATDSLGKMNYRVKLNLSFKDELVNSLNNLTVNEWQILEQIYQAGYFKENPDWLKAKSTVKNKGGEKKVSEPYWKKYLNGSSSLLDILKTIRPFELVGGKIVFRGVNSFFEQDGALIVIDGQRLGSDASQLTMINPLDVEDIRILLDPTEMAMYTALNTVGVIEIKTKHGSSNEKKSDEIVEQPANITSKLFSAEAIGEEKYNLKTTLQWVPVLFTDENGEVLIPFRTSSVKSTFILGIVGFSNQRQWITGQTEIKVE